MSTICIFFFVHVVRNISIRNRHLFWFFRYSAPWFFNWPIMTFRPKLIQFEGQAIYCTFCSAAFQVPLKVWIFSVFVESKMAGHQPVSWKNVPLCFLSASVAVLTPPRSHMLNAHLITPHAYKYVIITIENSMSVHQKKNCHFSSSKPRALLSVNGAGNPWLKGNEIFRCSPSSLRIKVLWVVSKKRKVCWGAKVLRVTEGRIDAELACWTTSFDKRISYEMESADV